MAKTLFTTVSVFFSCSVNVKIAQLSFPTSAAIGRALVDRIVMAHRAGKKFKGAFLLCVSLVAVDLVRLTSV